MTGTHRSTGAALAAVVVLLAACQSGPTTGPSSAVPPTPTAAPTTAATVLPTPTAAAAQFPLAVVTGLTNLKGTIALDDVTKLAADGKLVVPCGVEVIEPALQATAACVEAGKVVDAIAADPQLVALLPPGLVEPATRVLPIAGDGPYGLFGPDLFGDPQSRALPYPIQGRATGVPALDPTWTTYDVSRVWTMTSVGSLCADRGGAHQAVTLGKGWDWVFDGGTAKYKGKPIPNPNPPPGIDLHPIVQPIETGNDGVQASISKRADVAFAAHKCPILPTKDWKPNDRGRALNFAVPEDVLSRWQDFLGIDAVYLPADHQSDRGVTGIRSTLRLLDKYGIPHSGLGLDLDQALEPAYVEVGNLKIAFVSWDEVPGPTHASATKAGVAWLTEANVRESVRRAKAGGADLVVCDPMWWNGTEYAKKIWPRMLTQVGWFDRAGCDQVIGAGLHLAGPALLGEGPNGPRFVMSCTGNYMFGQDFWQFTQEGVILEEKFVGTKLVNVRLHPYVMIKAARAALTDPETDGHYVLDRIWKVSDLAYKP